MYSSIMSSNYYRTMGPGQLIYAEHAFEGDVGIAEIFHPHSEIELFDSLRASVWEFPSVFEARIQQGELADYPFLALVGTFTDQNFQFTSVCTGSVLTRRLILTTAHCFREEENWVVLMGFLAQEKYAAAVDNWILHPHYIVTVDATYNDVALIVTEKIIDFDRHNVKPISIMPLPPNVLHYDLICRMIGWQVAEPETFTVDVTSSDYTLQAQALTTVYSVKKMFLSPKQCQSLVNLIPDVKMMSDSSFMCVRHEDDFLNESQYGFIGSPLLCKEEEHDIEWTLMGLKLKQKNIENGMPELYVNIHLYEKYLKNTRKNMYEAPLKYFCRVKVCDKKYNVAGEYCLVGDDEDCYYDKGHARRHFFPVNSYTTEGQIISSEVLCMLVFLFH